MIYEAAGSGGIGGYIAALEIVRAKRIIQESRRCTKPT